MRAMLTGLGRPTLYLAVAVLVGSGCRSQSPGNRVGGATSVADAFRDSIPASVTSSDIEIVLRTLYRRPEVSRVARALEGGEGAQDFIVMIEADMPGGFDGVELERDPDSDEFKANMSVRVLIVYRSPDGLGFATNFARGIRTHYSQYFDGSVPGYITAHAIDGLGNASAQSLYRVVASQYSETLDELLQMPNDDYVANVTWDATTVLVIGAWKDGRLRQRVSVGGINPGPPEGEEPESSMMVAFRSVVAMLRGLDSIMQLGGDGADED